MYLAGLSREGVSRNKTQRGEARVCGRIVEPGGV